MYARLIRNARTCPVFCGREHVGTEAENKNVKSAQLAAIQGNSTRSLNCRLFFWGNLLFTAIPAGLNISI